MSAKCGDTIVFYAVVSRKPHTAFHVFQWKPWDFWIYAKFSEAKIIRDAARFNHPEKEFEVGKCRPKVG